MKIDKSLQDDHATLTLKGEFDTFYCPRFQEEVDGLLEQGIHHVVLHMRLVKMINSTALGAIIRAHKLCKAENGELVISRPSPFVKKVVTQVGIDQIVPMFDDEDEATKYIVQSLNQRELAGAAAVEEEKVLITFPDATRAQQLGGKTTVVGTMCNVSGEQLQFLWSGAKHDLTTDQARQLFFPGSEVGLKFQVKLFKKGFFEVTGKIEEAKDATESEIRVTASYAKIADSDRDALSQFAEDMQFLKRQLPR